MTAEVAVTGRVDSLHDENESNMRGQKDDSEVKKRKKQKLKTSSTGASTGASTDVCVECHSEGEKASGPQKSGKIRGENKKTGENLETRNNEKSQKEQLEEEDRSGEINNQKKKG